jgi:hypothetical protein
VSPLHLAAHLDPTLLHISLLTQADYNVNSRKKIDFWSQIRETAGQAVNTALMYVLLINNHPYFLINKFLVNVNRNKEKDFPRDIEYG